MTDTPDRPNEPANMQRGGRFQGGPSVIMQDINASIGFGRKLRMSYQRRRDVRVKKTVRRPGP